MPAKKMPLRFGLIGCGFFGQTQLHAWQEIEEARLAAVCDLDEEKARQAAETFGAARYYTDAEEMLSREEDLDFVDIVTTPPSHRPLVELAARHGLDIICQKPMAWSLEDGQAMVKACREAGVTFMVHENFRWQTPMREIKRLVEAGTIGRPFFGRISFRTDFDPFAEQAWLREVTRFIVIETAIHLLDLARFFFGEAQTLFCDTLRVNPTIKSEDVATIMLALEGATCLVDASFATATEHETFPETFVTLEGPAGVIHLGPDYRLEVICDRKMEVRTIVAPDHDWTTPPWEVMQDSALNIQRHWVECLKIGRTPETTGEDNLRVLELVLGAYESAETRTAYQPKLGKKGE